VLIGQAHERLVGQSGRVDRDRVPLAEEPVLGDPAQLGVGELHRSVARGLVTLGPRSKKFCHVALLRQGRADRSGKEAPLHLF